MNLLNWALAFVAVAWLASSLGFDDLARTSGWVAFTFFAAFVSVCLAALLVNVEKRPR